MPVTGDWNGDGTVTVGLYDPGSANWLLNNKNAANNPEYVFAYGGSGYFGVAGDWDGNGTDTAGVVVRP